MARNINVYLGPFEATGQTVQVDQYEMHIRLEWLDDEGGAHEWEDDVLFPNALAQVPASWLKGELADLVLRAARKKLDID